MPVQFQETLASMFFCEFATNLSTIIAINLKSNTPATDLRMPQAVGMQVIALRLWQDISTYA